VALVADRLWLDSWRFPVSTPTSPDRAIEAARRAVNRSHSRTGAATFQVSVVEDLLVAAAALRAAIQAVESTCSDYLAQFPQADFREVGLIVLIRDALAAAGVDREDPEQPQCNGSWLTCEKHGPEATNGD
jgi:hypothetical protein